MKRALPYAILLLGVHGVRAQEQEQKLIDRLLRPNTELHNHSQSKQFVADGSPITRKATVSAFYWQQKSNAKTFDGTRDFSTEDFNSHPFYAGRDASTFRTQKAKDSQQTANLPAARKQRSYHDSGKAASTRDFSGNRTFLEKGKSQKSLDRKNEPMTIEQVRELLNKSR